MRIKLTKSTKPGSTDYYGNVPPWFNPIILTDKSLFRLSKGADGSLDLDISQKWERKPKDGEAKATEDEDTDEIPF